MEKIKTNIMEFSKEELIEEINQYKFHVINHIWTHDCIRKSDKSDLDPHLFSPTPVRNSTDEAFKMFADFLSRHPGGKGGSCQCKHKESLDEPKSN